MSTMNNMPGPSQQYIDRGYGTKTTTKADPPTATELSASTPIHPEQQLEHTTSTGSRGRFNEEWDASQRGSSIIDGMYRSNSVMSQGETLIPTRGGTLKKKPSVKRTGSMKRTGSRRSSRAGSVRSLALHPGAMEDEENSAFNTPVPLSGNPTDVLANRFQQWRKILKDLITYFREIQNQYEHRAKSMLKISNLVNNIEPPNVFMPTGGINDALEILRKYHQQSIADAHKAKEIEEDVVLQLTGLRSDLQQKIKEIKSLSGDFKSSVGKEMDNTRKAVTHLQDALGQSDFDPTQATGKQDPYLLRLAVDRQVEKQIDEENYLHQAYLNLEASGTELEAIVVGEIQKSYNAYATILKREADFNYNTIDELKTGPISMPKDTEWRHFVENDEHFIDPRVPVRQAENIRYPGRDHELAAEVRAGLLERKSKYLKSYTGGWYVLSPTHLHEFKSADKTQAPVMSLYLPDQKLGSHSSGSGSSNKFILKGRQTGSMHRGHSWVFRAESHDTMMAWYEDIKALTEKSPTERNAFVRQHARSFSGISQSGSVSSDGGMDEEDDEPFSASQSEFVGTEPKQDVLPRRPEPGGRFPSDLQVNQRSSQAPLSPSSGSDNSIIHATNAPSQQRETGYGLNSPVNTGEMEPTRTWELNQYAQEDGVNPYTYEQLPPVSANHPDDAAVIGAGGVAAGVVGAEVYQHSQQNEHPAAHESAELAAPDTTHTKAQHYQQLATGESAQIAVDDTDQVHPAYRSTYDNHIPVISGGRGSIPDNNFDAVVSKGGESSLAESVHSATSQDTTDSVSTARPQPLENEQYPSVSSISQLHVPGRYPKDQKADTVN